MKHLRNYIYQKKRFLKTLTTSEYIKFPIDYFRYKKNINKKYVASIDEVFDYNIKQHNIKIKSPSLRLLKLMKIRYFDFNYLENIKNYFNNLSISKRGTIIDIGANIGYYSLIYSLIRPKSEIHSFEPSKLNFSYLNYHALQRNNIITYNFGLHYENDVSNLSFPSSLQNPSINKARDNTGLLSIFGSDNDFSEKIKLTTLDENVFNKQKPIKNIEFIKFDIEGNELNALKGSSETIKFFNPTLEIEVNEHALKMAESTPKQLISYVKSLGYNYYIYNGNKLEKISYLEGKIQNVIFISRKRG